MRLQPPRAFKDEDRSPILQDTTYHPIFENQKHLSTYASSLDSNLHSFLIMLQYISKSIKNTMHIHSPGYSSYRLSKPQPCCMTNPQADKEPMWTDIAAAILARPVENIPGHTKLLQRSSAAYPKRSRISLYHCKILPTY
jgi:hypothetical protein